MPERFDSALDAGAGHDSTRVRNPPPFQMIPKPKKRRDKGTAMAQADKAFSYFIRQRHAIEGICSCVSCGERFHWRGMDNGHYIGRAHMATRYDERNCAAQCKTCNQIACGKHARIWKHRGRGRHQHVQDVRRRHGEGLVVRYGAGILEELQRQGEKHQPTSREWFMEIEEKYREILEMNGWVLP